MPGSGVFTFKDGRDGPIRVIRRRLTFFFTSDDAFRSGSLGLIRLFCWRSNCMDLWLSSKRPGQLRRGSVGDSEL